MWQIMLCWSLSHFLLLELHWWSQVMRKIPVKGNTAKDNSPLKLGLTLNQLGLVFDYSLTQHFHHCRPTNTM